MQIEPMMGPKSPNRVEVLPQFFYRYKCPDEILNAIRPVVEAMDYSPNQENSVSIDHHLEKDIVFRDFFNWVNECLFDMRGNLFLECDRIKVTQAWANKSQPGQSHHWHSHPNSYASGVFYLTPSPVGTMFAIGDIWSPKKNFTGNLDLSIRGEKNPITHIEPSVPGTLVLFPSVVDHCVGTLPDDCEDRYTISFNTFPEGVIGSYSSLAGLKISVECD